MSEVVVVGGGPAGLVLAAELRLAGVGVAVLERAAERPAWCRGFTLSARSLDLLARRGLAERLLAEGHRVGHAAFGALPVTASLAGAHTDHPCTLGIPQTRVEELLEEHAVAAGAELRRGHALVGFGQDADGVIVRVEGPDGPYRERAAYLAGCDGSRSLVRTLAGIGFPGTPATRFTLLGDVEQDGPDPLPFGVTAGPGGSVFVIPRPGYVRVIVSDPEPSTPDRPATLDRLVAAVSAVAGREVRLVRPRWVTRFGNAARLAERYAEGRVLLAGDAAHVHPPAGAIGVNVAVDDAMNLGWKLAAALGGNPEPLRTYHAERHAAGARVLANTGAQALLSGSDAALDPLRDLLSRVFTRPDGSRALAEVLTGLDTCYPPGPGEPGPGPDWLGRLVPDLVVSSADAEVTLSDALRSGRGALLDLSPDRWSARAAGPWADRLPVLTGRCPAHPDLAAALVRPDGHAAWLVPAGQTDVDGLIPALTRWFGPAR